MTDIHAQVYESIRPVLDRADALLDYYLEDAPLHVWEPIVADIRAYEQRKPDQW